MRLELADIAKAIDATVADRGVVTGFSIDSRTVQDGDLFFAIRGETHDGHDHVAAALAKGARAAVVDRELPAVSGILIRTADTLKALQALAGWARRKWGRPVVGITGSAGKTTTKDVVASLLEVELKVGKTLGNFNNQFGLPLSILSVPDDADAAVIELGMNHTGEIRSLAAIARPDHGVVTNVGYAHIENFEDGIEGIARAKRELVEALPANGTAILNADDPRVTEFASVHAGPTVRYGLSPAADVRAESVELLEDGVRFRIGNAGFESPLLGRHGVSNILAGIAVAGVFDIAPDRLRDKIRSLTPGKMRGERLVHNGVIIFNDCYNSNPDAVRSMLDVLRDTPARRRIAVLGEMLELGRWAEPLHRDVGRYVVECGISVLVGIRGAARYVVDAAINAGHAVNAAYFFPTPEEAGKALAGMAQAGDAILFKGSRGTHVERALEKFLE
jgi:UDP-N-acetylmuramoyl-tripeptide--D-alanyl-D-alanine ligase